METHSYRVMAGGEEFFRAAHWHQATAFNQAKAEMIRLAEHHESATLERLGPDGWEVRARWSVAVPEDV